MTVAAGHNSKELTANETLAIKLNHLRTRMKFNAEISALQKAKTAAANLAKADGLRISTLDVGINALNAQDKNTPISKLMDEGQMLADLGMLPAWNADLMADRATRSEKVFAAAKIRGATGLDRLADYPPGSQDDNDDLAGWQEGQRLMREDLQSAMEKRQDGREDAEEGAFPD